MGTAADARDPQTVEWAIEQINQGYTLQQIREACGIENVNDWRWRVLRKEIAEFHKPKTDGEALTEFYVEQAERVRRLEEQLSDVENRIKTGKAVQIIETTDRHGNPKITAVEDKSFAQMFKTRNEIMKMLCDETDRQFKNFLDHSKVKRGIGKYAGAKITFISNVPRPEKVIDEVLDVAEALDEDGE